MSIEQEVKRLYLDQEKNIIEVSKIINVPVMTLYNKMLKWKIPIRGKRNPTMKSRLAKSLRYTRFVKTDFNGTLSEKAYLIGFHLGDLSAVRNSMAVRVVGATTHRAQVELIKSLFGKYGKVRQFEYENKIMKYEAAKKCVQVYVDLNQSFAFLLDKAKLAKEIPNCSAEEMWNFFAGFFDAEGCITVRRPSSGSIQFILAIMNKDFFTLDNLSHFLTKKKIHNVVKPSKENTRTLLIYRKTDVMKCLKQLKLYLKHEEKILKADFVLQNSAATRYDAISCDWKNLIAKIKVDARLF